MKSRSLVCKRYPTLFFRTILTFLLIAALIAVGSSRPVEAVEHSQERVLRTICEQGLAEVAIRYSQAQLKRQTEPELQALWAMRLMECHGQAGLRSDQLDAPHWATCRRLAEEFAEQSPDNPRLPWVAWQASRCRLLKIQLQVAQYLAVPTNESLRQSALKGIRQLLDECETQLNDLQRRQPLAARQSHQGGSEASAEALSQLSVDTVLLQCEALIARGRLYASDTTDRIAAATDVKTRTVDVLQRTAREWPARTRLQIAKAWSELQVGQSEAGLRELERIARQATDPRTQTRAAVIVIEQLIDSGSLSRTQPMLQILQNASADAELALANLHIALVQLERLDEQTRQAAIADVLDEVKSIGDRFGGYWRNRAEALLVDSIATDGQELSSSVGVELLMVEVRQLLAADKTQAAIDRLIAYRDQAATRNQAELAIQLASQAAALLQREQRWGASIEALEPIINQFTESERAAEANRVQLWARTQQLRESPSDTELCAAYENALHDHLKTWPDSPTSEQPQAWLTAWLVGQNRRPELMQALLDRIVQSRANEVTRKIASLWLEHFFALERSQRAEPLDDFRVRLQAMEVDPPSVDPPSVAPELILHLATLSMRWPEPGELEAMSAHWEQIDGVLGEEEPAYQWLVLNRMLSATRAGDWDGARRIARQWRPRVVDESIREGLTLSFVDAIDQLREGDGQLLCEILTIDRAWGKGLEAAPRPLYVALAHRIAMWLDDRANALEELSDLAESHPRQGDVQMQLAHALASGREPALEASSRIAARVAAYSQSGSELNLAARWRLVRNQAATGQRDAAKESAALLLAIQPEMPQVWQRRFESLAR